MARFGSAWKDNGAGTICWRRIPVCAKLPLRTVGCTWKMTTRILDNRDSFTRNLEHWLVAQTGDLVEVISYDDVTPATFDFPGLLVISPGPGSPSDYPKYEWMRERTGGTLGICLGMQIMNHLGGGGTRPFAGCFHGRGEQMSAWGRRFSGARYHSLLCDPVSSEYAICGRGESGIPMVLEHRCRPWVGFQFHPESFLTQAGKELFDDALEAMARRGWSNALTLPPSLAARGAR